MIVDSSRILLTPLKGRRKKLLNPRRMGINPTPTLVGHGLFDVAYPLEQSVPADAAEAVAVRVGAPPDEQRLADDMVFRHEAPVA